MLAGIDACRPSPPLTLTLTLTLHHIQRQLCLRVILAEECAQSVGLVFHRIVSQFMLHLKTVRPDWG